jgi:hypothetical protein
MLADMRPPSDDDVPMTLDWTSLDTTDNVAYLNDMNVGRRDADRRAS